MLDFTLYRSWRAYETAEKPQCALFISSAEKLGSGSHIDVFYADAVAGILFARVLRCFMTPNQAGPLLANAGHVENLVFLYIIFISLKNSLQSITNVPSFYNLF